MAIHTNSEPDPYRRLFKYPRWNGRITVLEEYKLFARLPEFDGWSKARHERAAVDYLTIAIAEQKMYGQLIDLGLHAFGDGTGVLISGVYRDHWPEAFKNDLRQLAHSKGEYRSKSLAHWRAAGKTRATWLRYCDQRAEQEQARS